MALGREFRWLWSAYAVSTLGTWLAIDAFGLVAVLVLHSGPAAVSLLAAAGPAVGAVVAVPLGPWVEFRRKRPTMIAMDLVRFAVLLSLPVAYAFDALRLGQLVLASVVVAAADITFTAASGACLKALVPPAELLRANGIFESTQWVATICGPPLGGAAIGLFGPVATVVGDAASYLLSAAGLRAMGRVEPAPAGRGSDGRLAAVGAGWRHIVGSPRLRPMFLNVVLVNGLIMAGAPLVAVLMLRDLGFPAWEYGLAFSLPCLGGLLGSRLSRPLVARFGSDRVLWVAGALRACWPIGLAFIRPGLAGLLLVVGVEFGLILCVGVFSPVYATYRLEHTPPDRVVRMMSAWSISTKAGIAGTTVLFGLLAGATSARVALGVAGVLLLATPVLLRSCRSAASAPARQGTLVR